MSGKRLALIIASSQYDDTDLKQLIAPAQDAEDFARVLADPQIGGFKVETLLNRLSHEVSPAIEAFFQGRRRDDLLLLYFSGHGLKDEAGQLYFAAPNTRRALPRTTAISANLVNEIMRHSRSQRQILILDCCYSGAFAKGMVAKSGQAIGAQERFKGHGRVVLTASDNMQYAFEGKTRTGKGVRSIFTQAMVEGLETGNADLGQDGEVSLDELYEYVCAQVREKTTKMTPSKLSLVQGKIIIAQNPVPVIKAAALPEGITQALASASFFTREGAVSELGRLLAGKDSNLALAAREELERLVEDDSRRVSRAAREALSGSGSSVAHEPGALTITSPVQMEFVRIPAGKFLMGTTEKDAAQLAKDGYKWAQEYETPQRRIHLAEYYMGKYPVTNAQFERFIKAAGYQTTAEKQGGGYVWTGSEWKKTKGADWRHPQGSKSDIAGKGQHPVVQVSWHDAAAFCAWLAAETGLPVRLPTEAEWEKAARGTDGRIYPWGDKWDADRANSRERGPGDTTAVGQYSPEGDSLYQIADASGNVWEWVADWFASGYYRTLEDGAQNPTGPASGKYRVLRGGGWYYDADIVRTAHRLRHSPSLTDNGSGFRCARSP